MNNVHYIRPMDIAILGAAGSIGRVAAARAARPAVVV
jgi:hypothetical protein